MSDDEVKLRLSGLPEEMDAITSLIGRQLEIIEQSRDFANLFGNSFRYLTVRPRPNAKFKKISRGTGHVFFTKDHPTDLEPQDGNVILITADQSTETGLWRWCKDGVPTCHFLFATEADAIAKGVEKTEEELAYEQDIIPPIPEEADGF